VQVQGTAKEAPTAQPKDVNGTISDSTASQAGPEAACTSQSDSTTGETPQALKATGGPPPNIAAGSADPEAAGGKKAPTLKARESAPQPEMITDVWEFKRRQELYPSCK